MRVLFGGIVRSLASRPQPADAMAHDGGRIVAVGSLAEVLAATPPNAERVDLQGGTVVPGFIDPHHHVALALTYEGAVDLRAEVVKDLPELLGRLRDAATRLPPGAWLVGHGYDEWRLAEQRVPSREELDQAVPDHPVLMLHFSFHQGVVNSRGLEALGLGKDTEDPPGGRRVRRRDGSLSGVLYESAVSQAEAVARRSILSREGDAFLERLDRYQERLFAVGITRVADPSVSSELEVLYQRAQASGRLRIPLEMMPVSDAGYLFPPADRLNGRPSGEAEGNLSVGPLKLFLDGGDNCAVCMTLGQALRASLQTIATSVARRSLGPLRGALRGRARLGRDFHLHSGIRFYPQPEQALTLASKAVERGFALAMHAMGNEALDQALDVVTHVRDRHPSCRPPRIEHASVVDLSVRRRAADLDVKLVVQPGFVRFFTTDTTPALPGLTLVPLKSLLGEGICVAASSDAPVGGFAPLEGIRAAMDRKNHDGDDLGGAEAIEALEALTLYTRNAAEAMGCLGVTGTLEVGKRADFVVLSSDPGTTPLERWSDVRVLKTVVAGETVYDAPAR